MQRRVTRGLFGLSIVALLAAGATIASTTNATTAAASAATAAATAAEPTGTMIVAPYGVHVLNDGTGRTEVLGSAGAFFQLFPQTAQAELTPLTSFESAVDIEEMRFSPDGELLSLVFRPTGDIPDLLGEPNVPIRSLHVSGTGEISGIEFATADDGPACVTIVVTDPDGGRRLSCDNQGCDPGFCSLRIISDGGSGYIIACQCARSVDPGDG